jgi:hypothetical protein
MLFRIPRKDKDYIRVWNVDGALDSRKGITRYVKISQDVTKAVFGMSDSSIRIR